MFTSRLIKVDSILVLKSRTVHKFRLFKNKYESNGNCGIRCSWLSRPYCTKFYVKNSLLHFVCQNGLKQGNNSWSALIIFALQYAITEF